MPLKSSDASVLQRVEQSVVRRGLLKNNQRILVAVSGGLDSMVLLHLLHELASKHRWSLVVAHFNHHLRAAASDSDERLVRNTARNYRLPVVVGHWSKKDQVSAKQFGLEMAARIARHDFFKTQARRHKLSTIALAHHADDQVELFLMRLLRGSGSEGLAGMKWRNPSPADKRLFLVRPLLDFRKSELASCADAFRIRFREDASNRNPSHDRNWLRQKILPALERRFGPSSVHSILRAAELLNGDSDFVRTAAQAWLSRQGPEPFAALHPALQRQILREELKRLNLSAGFERVEELRLLPGQPITIAPAIRILRDSFGRITPCPDPHPQFRAEQSEFNLGPRGKITFGQLEIRWQIEKQAGQPRHAKTGNAFECFDALQVGSRIKLRFWQPGDRFQPCGMMKPVKLQDLFTNAKIPPSQRRNLIVAESARGEIFWVESLRIAERFKLQPTSRVRLKWSWRRRQPG